MLTSALEAVGLLLIVAGIVVALAGVLGWGWALAIGGVLVIAVSWLLVRLGAKS